MDATDFDRAAAEVASKLPPSFRVAIIGSTSFWHPDSEETCSALGRVLAYMRDLALVTGGVGGVGDTVARRFWDSREGKDGDRGLFHVLPLGYGPRKVGRTLFAGADMAERREILGRLADLYVVIEGGPGTVHEASVALARAAGVLPVGRSGGHSAELHRELLRPSFVPERTWSCLACAAAEPEEVADALGEAINAFHKQIERGASKGS